MQVPVAFGFIDGFKKRDGSVLHKRLMFAAAAILAAAPLPLKAQPAVLDALREAVVSRWDFQQRFPAAAKLFAGETGASAGQANESERTRLVADLRAAQPKPVANSASPTFADL